MGKIKYVTSSRRKSKNTKSEAGRMQTAFPAEVTEAKSHLSAHVVEHHFPSLTVHVVEHHFPSPALSYTEDPPLVGHVSHVTIPEERNEYLEPSCDASSPSRELKHVHIATRLMEEFMELARDNTNKDLETCGVLGAFLRSQTFYVTTLIVPKQESSSNSCEALNEEEIHSILDQQSLFALGWIHVMLPEALAIVMAPTDPTRRYGIFRLTQPQGVTVLARCHERGFHSHPETDDGTPIYNTCSNVFVNPNLRFEIFDLRSS